MALLPPDPLFRFKSDMGHLHCICFAEDDPWRSTADPADVPSILLAAGESGVVYFWDLEKNRQKFKQLLGVSIQTLHSYGKQVIVQEKQGLLKMFSPGEDLDLLEYKLDASLGCAMGFCRSKRLDAHTLLVPQDHDDVMVVAYDLRTWTKVKDLQLSAERAYGQLMCLECAASKDNMLVLCGFEAGDVLLLDYASGQQMAHAKFQCDLTCMTMDAAGMRGVVGTASSNVLQVFSVDRNLHIEVKCELSMSSGNCSVVKVRPDRKVLLVGSGDGRVRIYSWKTLRLLASLSDHRSPISDVQFTMQEVKYWRARLMAVTGADGVISLWSLYN